MSIKIHQQKKASLSIVFILANFYFLYQVSAEGAPRKLSLTDEQKIIFTHVGQSLELKCPIEMPDTDEIFVDWYRGFESLYMEPGYETTGRGEEILKIKSVTKEHSGTYTCEGINGYGAVQVNITVIVDDPETENSNNTPINPNSVNTVNVFPPTIRKRPAKNFIDEVGGQAIFHCVASGQPTPHIFWLKNGELIQNVETETLRGKVHSTLKMRGLKVSDAGTYKCIARNKVGEDSTEFNLEITENPKPPRIVSLQPPTATIKEGEAVVFWCEVNSKPGLKLHIKWLKRLNKEEIGDSLNLDHTLFRLGNTFYRPLNLSDETSNNIGVDKSKLLIRNSCKEDSGTYVCLALNDKGFNFKNVTLTVISTVKSFSAPSYFSSRDTSFIVTALIAIGIVLLAVVLVLFFCCRGKSQKRARMRPATGAESINKKTSPVLKPGKEAYAELSDLQSKSKLLYPESIYSFETENHIAKSELAKNSFH